MYLDRKIALAQAVFGKNGLDNEATPTSPTPGAFGAMANFLVPKLPAGLGGTFSQDRTNTADQSKIIKRERHAIRPPVEHNWSLPGTSVDLKPPQIFKHELLQNFAINMFCKVFVIIFCFLRLFLFRKRNMIQPS